MLTIRNRKTQARAIDFSRDYPGVGRSVYLRPNEIREGIPDEAADEKDLTRLEKRGIISVTRPALKVAPPETKAESTRPRRAAATKTEREE